LRRFLACSAIAMAEVKTRMPSALQVGPSTLVPRVGSIFLAVAVPSLLYAAFILALVAFPTLEAHVIYMHRLTLMRSVDALNTPELFGFMRNQVRPFTIPLPAPLSVGNISVSSLTAPPTSSSSSQAAATETLHAWHVLPLRRYSCHQEALVAEPAGLVDDVTTTHGFSLLRDDPCAIVVIHLHGASGTMASGLRPETYRALAAADPTHVHVLALDYRGYGLSSGSSSPCEGGLIADAVALARWAMDVAQVPPERIVVHAQSLGTAVAIGMVEYFATQQRPVEFGGLVLTAGMFDVASLMAEYRFNGVLRLMAPLDWLPAVLDWMRTKLRSTWRSGERLERVMAMLSRHHVELLHAQDDRVVSVAHVHRLFEAAVAGSVRSGAVAVLDGEVNVAVAGAEVDVGASGAVWEWKSERGLIRKRVLSVGEHDRLMILPATSCAVLDASMAAGWSGGESCDGRARC